MSTFLSLDLDYFGMSYGNPYCSDIKTEQDNKDYILNFISNLFKLETPIIIMNHHQNILRLLNHDYYTKVINIDFHSDIVTDPDDDFEMTNPLPLNEGTWANHYKYRRVSNYEWWMPSRKVCFHNQSLGICGLGRGLNKEWKPKQMGYETVTSKLGIQKLPKDITGVGICVSPEWYDRKKIKFVFDKFKILSMIGDNSSIIINP